MKTSRKSITDIWFDEVDYLLRYPDVRAAVAAGGFDSGKHHYDWYGQNEGRTCRSFWLGGRASWFLRQHLGVLVKLVRPARNQWSGLTLSLWRCSGVPGYLSVSIFCLSKTGIHRVRHKRLSLSDMDDRNPPTIYWAPLPDAAGRRFLVVVRQLGTDDRPLRPSPFVIGVSDEQDALAYSEAKSPHPFPKALLFSPVTQCNLNCIHCISRHTRQRLSVLGGEAWSEIAAAAREGHLDHLRSDYSGDILFSDHRHGGWLDRMIALNIELMIDTHANDLTADAVERLMRSRLCWINFSLDSMDPDDYPKIRRGARPLEEVITNIRRFMAARNARRPEIMTILSFVIMRRNLDSLAAAIDLAADLKISAIWCNHLHAYTNDMADESLMLEPGRYERVHRALMTAAREKGVSLGMPNPFRASAALRSHTPCDYPWHSMAVLGNGDVMACNVPGTRVGNLRDGNLAQLWNGPAMRAFRARVNTDDPPDSCSVCPMRRVENNFASYVPGLTEDARRNFERRCLKAALYGDEVSGARALDSTPAPQAAVDSAI